MARCEICDWSSEGIPSDYHLGIRMRKTHNKKIIFDGRLGQQICTDCLNYINLDLQWKRDGDKSSLSLWKKQ